MKNITAAVKHTNEFCRMPVFIGFDDAAAICLLAGVIKHFWGIEALRNFLQ